MYMLGFQNQWALTPVVLVLFLFITGYSVKFTCQGPGFESSLGNCPDFGLQRMSSGGNVSVVVKRAINMPNKDFSGPASGVSDPYVKFTFGKGLTAQSKVIRNSLNPIWEGEGDKVPLGLLGSATSIQIDVYDYDIGTEFDDDLMFSTVMRVPFCSMFSTKPQEINCGRPFGCSAEDSSWAMPKRLVCNETGWINLSGDKYNQQPCIDGYAPCLLVEFIIIPFEVKVELAYDKMFRVGPPDVTALADQRPDVPWSGSQGYHFGNIYKDTAGNRFDLSNQYSKELRGGIMMSFSTDDKSIGPAEEVVAYITMNFPATVYVCRYEGDNKNDPDLGFDGLGVPLWLQQWNQDNLTSTKLKLANQGKNFFECYWKSSTGTKKNKWGGVEDGAVELRSNTIKGYEDLNINQPDYKYMYSVVIVPHALIREEDVIVIEYSASSFIGSIFMYGLIWSWFMYLVARFLKRIDYRVERVQTFLISRVYTGDDKTILATLFMGYKQTPCNIEFRGHLYHATNAIYFFMMIPSLLLIGWGFCAATFVKPEALGYGIAFFGNAAIFVWFGTSAWESQKWRMSPVALISLALSVVFAMMFIVSMIFVDPGVRQFHHKLNFPALSLLFGTLNAIPLLLLIFKQDKTYKEDLTNVIELLTQAAYSIKEQDGKNFSQKKKRLPANKALHAILGSVYTLNPLVPQFKFATVLEDGVRRTDLKKVATLELRKRGDPLYNASLCILFAYLMIAVTRTDFPSLSFLNCLTLILFDTINTALSHGDTRWTPGFKIFLLVVGRLLIMSSGMSMWLVNYSLGYMVYSIALVEEIINSILPMLTERQAGEQAFSGKTEDNGRSQDLAGTAFFNFSLLTFAFVALLMVCAYAFDEHSEQLSMSNVSVAGDTWPVYVFGLIAVLFVITGGMVMATIRGFYLQRHGLLRGFAREGYLFRPELRIPTVIAIGAEVALVSSGVILRAATGSNAILVVCVFFPFIVACFTYCYGVWVANDYELVIWPPKDAVDSYKDDAPSDLEVAFHMIENLFGDDAPTEEYADVPETNDDSGAAVSRTGFKLPPLTTTEGKVGGPIKMPPLPLKSVLRKKREALGLVPKKDSGTTAAPPQSTAVTVKRTDAGIKIMPVDVIEPTDIWSQYDAPGDEEEVEDEEQALRKSLLGNGKQVGRVRKGFLEHPSYLAMRDKIVNSKFGKRVYEFYMKVKTSIENRRRAYSTVTPKDGDIELAQKEEEEEEEVLKDEIADNGPYSENISKMNFWKAAFSGYLLANEYSVLAAWYTGLFLVFLMGITLSKTVSPAWLGNVIWVAVWLFIHTFVPIYKYFHTYKIDYTMKACIVFSVLLHFVFCLTFFGAVLNFDIGVPATLWDFDFFIYYPAFLYILIEAYKWKDGGWQLEKLDKDGDGEVTAMEWIQYMQLYPLIFVMMIVLNWQYYLWIDSFTGLVLTLLLIVGFLCYFFVHDWATNELYVSPNMMWIGEWIFNIILAIDGLVCLFYQSNPMFPLSVFFVVLMGRQSIGIIMKIMVADPDTIFFISPMVMPIYSYNSNTNDVEDESDLARSCFKFLVTGILYGFTVSIFQTPLSIGIATSSFFLLIFAAFLATAITHVPLQLGRLSSMISLESIKNAANTTRATVSDRKSGLSIVMRDWVGPGDEDFGKKPKPIVEQMKSSEALILAADIIIETRALSYAHLDETDEKIHDIDDTPYKEPSWYGILWMQFKDNMKKLMEMIPADQMQGWKKHSESMFSFTDACAEAVIAGKGPLGFLGFDGLLYSMFKKAQENPRLKFLRQPWLNIYDEFGNKTSNIQLYEGLDSISHLMRFSDIEKALDHCYKEEARAGVHFMCMLIVAAEAKLGREKVLFQKFLRENRFRLASNGITPPAEVFSSASFSSIDIPLVAVWLSTLTPEERERFNMLKATFSEEQRVKDEAIDEEDRVMLTLADKLKQEREYRALENTAKATREGQVEMARRTDEFIHGPTLNPVQKSILDLRKSVWLSNADCYIDPKDDELYTLFRQAVFVGNESSVEYARRQLAELEAGKFCVLGEFGRNYQFNDPEFPASDHSLGPSSSATPILGWRCGPGLSDGNELFKDGADADDVYQGVFNDQWLLAAVSMLAGGGGGEKDPHAVHEAIQNLFVGHYTSDGVLTWNTEVGAYCVRLHKHGMSIPLIVDDKFPMLQTSLWTNENKGVAVAHAQECTELWVTLIEKAFAKFYGSYTELEKGYVHHALEELTGCETECITLASASRGVGKRTLWEKMMRFRRNGYILGAGTGSSELVDREIVDMGIQFGASYTIFDVRHIDGHRLIKLRNPPGDHDEWKGDWSDKSDLWTKRLKHKLGWTDEDDNCFWMSFDDFCNVFRYLYCCKWYSKAWRSKSLPGIWKKSNETDETEKAKVKEKKDFSKDVNTPNSNDIKTRVDTAGGLPHKHNPGCILENNPHYSLNIHRPTDVRITVSQTDSRGVSVETVLPFAVFVVKNSHQKHPVRLQKLDRDNVVAYTGEPKIERVQNIYTSLKPGLYVILVGAYMMGMEGNFTITVLSNYKSEFTPVWPPKWMMKKSLDDDKDDGDLQVADAARAAIEGVGKRATKRFQAFFGISTDESDDEDDKGKKKADIKTIEDKLPV